MVIAMFGSKQIFLIARHIQCMTLRFHTLYNLALPRATMRDIRSVKTLHLASTFYERISYAKKYQG